MKARVSMALTEHERRVLGEIGDDLLREDPRLARSLARPAGRRRRAARTALVLVAISMATELVGATERQPLVCGLAWLGMTIGTMLFLATNWLPGRQSRKPD